MEPNSAGKERMERELTAPDPLDPAATKGAEWPRIALCAVHEEWWAVEKLNDENCPYPGCSGPVTIYAAEEPHRA